MRTQLRQQNCHQYQPPPIDTPVPESVSVQAPYRNKITLDNKSHLLQVELNPRIAEVTVSMRCNKGETRAEVSRWRADAEFKPWQSVTKGLFTSQNIYRWMATSGWLNSLDAEPISQSDARLLRKEVIQLRIQNRGNKKRMESLTDELHSLQLATGQHPKGYFNNLMHYRHKEPAPQPRVRLPQHRMMMQPQPRMMQPQPRMMQPQPWMQHRARPHQVWPRYNSMNHHPNPAFGPNFYPYAKEAHRRGPHVHELPWMRPQGPPRRFTQAVPHQGPSRYPHQEQPARPWMKQSRRMNLTPYKVNNRKRVSTRRCTPHPKTSYRVQQESSGSTTEDSFVDMEVISAQNTRDEEKQATKHQEPAPVKQQESKQPATKNTVKLSKPATEIRGHLEVNCTPRTRTFIRTILSPEKVTSAPCTPEHLINRTPPASPDPAPLRTWPKKVSMEGRPLPDIPADQARKPDFLPTLESRWSMNKDGTITITKSMVPLDDTTETSHVYSQLDDSPVLIPGTPPTCKKKLIFEAENDDGSPPQEPASPGLDEPDLPPPESLKQLESSLSGPRTSTPVPAPEGDDGYIPMSPVYTPTPTDYVSIGPLDEASEETQNNFMKKAANSMFRAATIISSGDIDHLLHSAQATADHIRELLPQSEVEGLAQCSIWYGCSETVEKARKFFKDEELSTLMKAGQRLELVTEYGYTPLEIKQMEDLKEQMQTMANPKPLAPVTKPLLPAAEDDENTGWPEEKETTSPDSFYDSFYDYLEEDEFNSSQRDEEKQEDSIDREMEEYGIKTPSPSKGSPTVSPIKLRKIGDSYEVTPKQEEESHTEEWYHQKMTQLKRLHPDCFEDSPPPKQKKTSQDTNHNGARPKLLHSNELHQLQQNAEKAKIEEKAKPTRQYQAEMWTPGEQPIYVNQLTQGQLNQLFNLDAEVELCQIRLDTLQQPLSPGGTSTLKLRRLNPKSKPSTKNPLIWVRRQNSTNKPADDEFCDSP